MRNLFTTAAGMALLAIVNADLCTSGSAEIMGNFYCQAVDTIQYQNFRATGSYNRITSMDPDSATCSSEPFGYSGSLAPLNGEISFHVRGPTQLKKFAFYTTGSPAKSKRSHSLRHSHHHFHEKRNDSVEKKRDVGDWVTVTMNGQVVSWINAWDGAATPTAAVAGVADAITSVTAQVAGAAAPTADANASAKPHGKPFRPHYKGEWVRAGYYDAASGHAEGVSFLNNMGGQGSGCFDYSFGNSLSYASADGMSGSTSPQILEDTTLPSNTEIVLMSDKHCTAGSGCGYSRPGTVAHHGFGGESKVFLMEFAMPSDGTSGFNADMPAIWLLNAEIPRTLQYGQADCSCWASGCGEFDLFEVLDSGNTRCKSTLHGGVQGGDSDYFDRPTSAPIKAAVVMSDDMATIKILPDSFDFSKTLTNEQVAELGSHTDGGLLEQLGVSLFNLVSPSE